MQSSKTKLQTQLRRVLEKVELDRPATFKQKAERVLKEEQRIEGLRKVVKRRVEA